MNFYDGNGNIVKINNEIDGLNDSFNVKQAQLIEKPFESPTVLQFPGDGIYSANPWVTSGELSEKNRRYIFIQFLDDKKSPIRLTGADEAEITYLRNLANYFYEVKGYTVTIHWIYAFEDYKSGEWNTGQSYTLQEIPTYISCKVDRESDDTYFGMTYNFMSDSKMLNWDVKNLTINIDKTTGFLEQINAYIDENTKDNILSGKDIGKIIKSTIIRENNRAKDALRIATYNIYGAGMGQKNWNTIKYQLQDFGIDICAFQEVKSPNGNLDSANTKIFADEMTGWQFPYCSSNGDLHPVNERMLLSRYDIAYSNEFEFNDWSSDKRCLAKYEIQLPLFKDRVGSDQIKMSVYNTQLEVYPSTSGNATNRISEAQQILDEIAKDKNPFVVVCMDSNDFSPDKEIWKMFTDAGFTYAISIKSQTVRDQNNCIDQIFINKNMKIINYDVINSNLYLYKKDGRSSAVSDHDLCFADISLSYDNFYCIKQQLTNVIADFSEVITDNESPLTINLTAEEGHTIGTVTVRMGANDVTSSTYLDGVITIPKVTGDVYIIAEAS